MKVSFDIRECQQPQPQTSEIMLTFITHSKFNFVFCLNIKLQWNFSHTALQYTEFKYLLFKAFSHNFLFLFTQLALMHIKFIYIKEKQHKWNNEKE